MAEILKGIPINTLPETETVEAEDELIAYREDNGKAYRAKASSISSAGHIFLTQAEYDALPDSKLTDNNIYFISD